MADAVAVCTSMYLVLEKVHYCTLINILQSFVILKKRGY